MSSGKTGKELYEEWSKHDKSGVLGASTHFTQSLSPEERKRLFDYDAELQKGTHNTTKKGKSMV